MPEIIENQYDIKDLISSTLNEDPKDRPSAMHVKQYLERHIQGDRKSVESPSTYNPFRCVISDYRDLYSAYLTFIPC